mmetsp:Transcript_22621/g.70243  ORF Transcript_22621/g.70243 Transcript_22621/m.70243 type:complete len:210 (+) Transcript_22621:2977-3606(+)
MGEGARGRQRAPPPAHRPGGLHGTAREQEPRAGERDRQGVHEGGDAQRAHRALGEDCAAELRLLRQPQPPEPAHPHGRQGRQDPGHGLHHAPGALRRPRGGRDRGERGAVRGGVCDLQEVFPPRAGRQGPPWEPRQHRARARVRNQGGRTGRVEPGGGGAAHERARAGRHQQLHPRERQQHARGGDPGGEERGVLRGPRQVPAHDAQKD